MIYYRQKRLRNGIERVKVIQDEYSERMSKNLLVFNVSIGFAQVLLSNL